jgi:hypothetical protein
LRHLGNTNIQLFRELLHVLIAGLVPIAVILLIVTGTAFSLVAWQPPILKTIQFGTPDSNNGISAITSDPTGVYAAGFVGDSGVSYHNATPTYLFVNKYNFNGGLVWSSHFDNPYRSTIYSITAGPSGVYIAESSNDTSLVRGFDLDGNQLWISLSNIALTSLSVASTGIYVAGYNGTAYFLRDYGFNGSLVWGHPIGTYEGPVSVYAALGSVFTVSAETSSSLGVTSTLVQSFDPNGTLLWGRTCSCDITGITGDSSGVYAAGHVQTGYGSSNGFLARYDPNGNQLWNTSFSTPGYNAVGDVGVSADSSGAFLAVANNGATSFVLRYDSSGNHFWTVQQPSGTSGNAITVQSTTIYVGGSTFAQAAFMMELGESSSLIFFGVNPPLSFGLLAALIAGVLLSILWLKRELKKRHRPLSTSLVLRSKKIPSDMYGGI